MNTMLLLIYIGHVFFGVYAGYLAGQENDNEHQTVAILVFVAMLTSATATIFASFVHIFSVFFVWLVFAWLTSELVKFIAYRRF